MFAQFLGTGLPKNPGVVAAIAVAVAGGCVDKPVGAAQAELSRQRYLRFEEIELIQLVEEQRASSFG